MKPSTSGGDRVIDPVVARLKAARRAEREKLELMKREKKGMPPKKKSTGSNSKSVPLSGSNTRNTNNIKRDTRKTPLRANLARNPLPPIAKVPVEKHPKMSFAQLMQKASSIDQTRLSIEIKGNKSQENTSKKPLTSKTNPTGPNLHNISNSNNSLRKMQSNVTSPSIVSNSLKNLKNSKIHNHLSKNGEHNKSRDSGPVTPAPISRAPLPIRKPSSQLQERLKKSGRLVQGSKKHRSKSESGSARSLNDDNEEDDHDESEIEDEDDDLDSFIESDEELEEDVADYDRDEIWSMFNRGRKRTYYNHEDSDSDDMEATGAEILAEEARSKRNALEEDRREQEEEKRLAALKRARKLKNGR